MAIDCKTIFFKFQSWPNKKKDWKFFSSLEVWRISSKVKLVLLHFDELKIQCDHSFLCYIKHQILLNTVF